MPGQTLAQTVRAKYPGIYDDLSDQDLEAKVRAKYPGVYDDMPSTPAKASPVAAPSSGPTTMQSAFAAAMGLPVGAVQSAQDLLIGAGKSVLGTIQGGGNLIRSIPKVGPALDAMGSVTLPVTPQPSNTMQTVGKVAGDIGQFMLPGAALGKVKMALATGSGLLDALVGAGVEGASAGAIGSAQTGSLAQGGKIGLATAGTTAAMSGLLAAAKPLSEKIENVLVKPSKADLADGFDPENVFKYNVGGTLSQSYDKVTAKIKNLASQLQSTLTNAPDAPTVDLGDALNETVRTLHVDSAGTFGQNAAIDSAVKKLAAEIPSVTQSGSVDLATGNKVKQAVGSMGAWNHGAGMQDESTKAMETVANAYYDTLKTRIEQAVTNAPGRVQQINGQISDLIPIQRAIVRRIPIAQRNSILNLGDLLGLASGRYWVGLLNKGLMSGTGANVLNAAGEAAPSLAPAVGRTVAGVMAGGGSQ
jgi:hypothetical protein